MSEDPNLRLIASAVANIAEMLGSIDGRLDDLQVSLDTIDTTVEQIRDVLGGSSGNLDVPPWINRPDNGE